MDTVLKISQDNHKRLKSHCDKVGVPLRSGSDAILSFSLDALDEGRISLNPVSAVEKSGRSVSHSGDEGKGDA